jgi:hypothetical protein
MNFFSVVEISQFKDQELKNFIHAVLNPETFIIDPKLNMKEYIKQTMNAGEV